MARNILGIDLGTNSLGLSVRGQGGQVSLNQCFGSEKPVPLTLDRRGNCKMYV